MLNITVVYNVVYTYTYYVYITNRSFLKKYYHSVGAVMMLISVELLFD